MSVPKRERIRPSKEEPAWRPGIGVAPRGKYEGTAFVAATMWAGTERA